jgi:hypothetical protein
VSEDGGATPVSWLLIERGWKVVDADGIFNGLAVAHGLLGRPRYVPAERVAEITEGQVRLALSGDDVGRLDEHEPPPPSERLRP